MILAPTVADRSRLIAIHALALRLVMIHLIAADLNMVCFNTTLGNVASVTNDMSMCADAKY